MRRLYADSGAVMRARTRFHPPAPRRRAHTAPPLQSEYQRVPEPRSSRRQRAECHRSCRIREARSSSAAVLQPAHVRGCAHGWATEYQAAGPSRSIRAAYVHIGAVRVKNPCVKSGSHRGFEHDPTSAHVDKVRAARRAVGADAGHPVEHRLVDQSTRPFCEGAVERDVRAR